MGASGVAKGELKAPAGPLIISRQDKHTFKLNDI